MHLKKMNLSGAAAMKMLTDLIHLGSSKTQHVRNIDSHGPKIVPIPNTFAGFKSASAGANKCIYL